MCRTGDILGTCPFASVFFFNDTAPTEIYTLSLHDALPISLAARAHGHPETVPAVPREPSPDDRQSTRLNSSHPVISYAVFCLKKKKQEVGETEIQKKKKKKKKKKKNKKKK